VSAGEGEGEGRWAWVGKVSSFTYFPTSNMILDGEGVGEGGWVGG
jgi:hypothetical protein